HLLVAQQVEDRGRPRGVGAVVEGEGDHPGGRAPPAGRAGRVVAGRRVEHRSADGVEHAAGVLTGARPARQPPVAVERDGAEDEEEESQEGGPGGGRRPAGRAPALTAVASRPTSIVTPAATPRAVQRTAAARHGSPTNTGPEATAGGNENRGR